MINKPKSDSNRVNGKKAGILAKMALLLFLAVAGVEESKAQRDITKDTTEVRAFFNNPKVFTAEEIAEFDMIWQEMLNNPKREHIMKYLHMAYNDEQSRFKNVVLTYAFLDPDKKTSLGKLAHDEVEKSEDLQKNFSYINEGIYRSECSEKKKQENKKKVETIKQNEEKIKQNEEKIKQNEEKIKQNEEKIKQNKEKIKQNEEKIKQNEEKIKQNEEKIKQKDEEIKQKDEEIKQNEEKIKQKEEFLDHLKEMKNAFEELKGDKK